MQLCQLSSASAKIEGDVGGQGCGCLQKKCGLLRSSVVTASGVLLIPFSSMVEVMAEGILRGPGSSLWTHLLWLCL